MKANFRYPFMCFLLLLGAHLLGAPGEAETDSTKYPVNDPRNPNCPCHQYQAQADREYAKQVAISNGSENKIQTKVEPFGSSKKLKKARQRHWFGSTHQTHRVKVIPHKRFRDRLSRCFHF